MRTSIVIPVFNEVDCIAGLLREIDAAAARLPDMEVIVVNDGSNDETASCVRSVSRECQCEIRLVTHRTRAGQSSALLTGVRHARGEWVVTLDGDGQNDPADVPRLLRRLQTEWLADARAVCAAGIRRRRQDGVIRRASSRVANGVRRRVLKDGVPDTGCGIKAFRRDAFLALPPFDHLHRFIPALLQAAGWRVIMCDVNHRPRMGGQSKYGISNRLWVGLVDMLGVRWLQRRQVVRADDVILE